MTTTVRVVCAPGVMPGFALAGVAGEPVSREAEVVPVLQEVMRRRDVGVVLLQEDLYESLPSDIRAKVDRSAAPVVVPFPGPAWTGMATAEERVIELLRRAIGYRVKLR